MTGPEHSIPDPSTNQTASGIATTFGIDSDLKFSNSEKELLKNLAREVAEIASGTEQEKKKIKWRKHNDLEESGPLIFCDPENGWNEIITQDLLQCRTPLARVWEMALKKEIFWGREMKDDRVVEACFNVPYHYTSTGYGLSEKKIGGRDGGSFVYDYPIRDYEKDFGFLTMPELLVDMEKTNDILELAHELFDGILKVRLKGIWWWSLGLTREFIKLRGLENLMLDMMLTPDWVHRLMEYLAGTVHHKLDFLEKNNLLSLNNDGSYVGSGGLGFSSQLPQADFQEGQVRTMDIWGFTESQETVGIAPEMFNEFVLPYELPILERFGLNCYGCCEPMDPRWEYAKRIPRLRRVSVSPWADVAKMAEYLKQDYILSMKPSPTPLASNVMNEAVVRKELADNIEKAKGCFLEIIMKDNHTLGKNPMNAVRWCEIAREEIERIW